MVVSNSLICRGRWESTSLFDFMPGPAYDRAMSHDSEKSVSLVLGSGGARGLAHIGVIQWLEANGYNIRSISGCSMGALIGGVYACGELHTFEDWVRAITKLDMLRLLDISWGNQGLVEGDRIIEALKELIGDRQIEALPIKYTAVAADIKREKEIWLTEGSLFDAIRASISLPLFFTPFELNGMMLLDGGVLNPVPIAPTFKDSTDLTIAINLGGEPRGKKHPVVVAAPQTSTETKEDLGTRISNWISGLTRDSSQKDGGDWKMLDIADKTFDAMQGAIARQKLAAYPPDRTLTIARDACGTLEFDRAEEMIALGFETAQAELGSA